MFGQLKKIAQKFQFFKNFVAAYLKMSKSLTPESDRIKTYHMMIFDRERNRYEFRGDHSKRLPNQVDSGYNAHDHHYCLVDLRAN